MTIERPPGVDALAAGYGPLLDRAREVFAADERVRAMWLHGAVARRAADAGSDLDIDIAVADDAFEDFVAAWPAWLAAITPTVNVQPIPGLIGSFYALTPTCERLDVITERVSSVPSSFLTRRVTVFDRDGLTSLVPEPVDPPPDQGTIAYLITEPIRQAANWPTVVVRKDWLLGVVAVEQVHSLLYALFAEANKPQAPTGPKQWSHKLSGEHRRMLEALPVPQPEPTSVEQARRAALRLFFDEAPKIAAANGVPWPAELADAVLSFLEREGFAVD